MTSSQTPEPASQLPPFYKSPKLIDNRRHEKFGLKPTGYGFARDNIWVHLNAIEFGVASKHYPIVFTDSEQPAPIAILGLKQGGNLFIESDDAKWVPFTYVFLPMSVATRLFWPARPTRNGSRCASTNPVTGVSETEGAALFEDGKRTKLVEDALELCGAFPSGSEGHADLLQRSERT